MQRMTNVTLGAFLMLLATPATALAGELTVATSRALHLGTSLLGLAVAVVLLLEALGVRRVALGGAIAEKISYVVLAILCLATSALARWTGNFVSGMTLAQTQLASELLVIVAMALLAAYFFSVRSAMQAYLKIMTGSEQFTVPATGAGIDADVSADGAVPRA